MVGGVRSVLLLGERRGGSDVGVPGMVVMCKRHGDLQSIYQE